MMKVFDEDEPSTLKSGLRIAGEFLLMLIQTIGATLLCLAGVAIAIFSFPVIVAGVIVMIAISTLNPILYWIRDKGRTPS